MAARLWAGEEPSVAVRRRLFVVNDEPVALWDSYYPREVAEGTALAQHERIAGGAYGLIEEPGRSDRATAAALDRRLGVPDAHATRGRDASAAPGVPVVRILRTVYDSDGQAVEVPAIEVLRSRYRR